MDADDIGVAEPRDLITSDATVLAGLLLVVAAAFDMVWLLITAVAISSFPKPLAVAVAALAFLGSIAAQVVLARRPGLSFDADTVWWSTGFGKKHRVARANVKFGVRRRFGVSQATISDGNGPAVTVPRLAAIPWTAPESTVAVRERDPKTGKQGDWVDTGQRWKDLDAETLERTLDDDALTRAIYNASRGFGVPGGSL